MALCQDNGKKHKYDAPLTSQDEVHICYNRIKILKEQDKLAILRREIKLKKIMFSELPSDFVYFKQYNISSKQMYENLLALHSVDQFNQEVITVEDVYEATDLLDSPAAQSLREKNLQHPLQQNLNWISNGLLRRRSLLLLWKKMVGTLGQSNLTTRSKIPFVFKP